MLLSMPRAGRADARRAALSAPLLAGGGVAWLVVLHHAQGAREDGEPSLAVHVLRDATLALPAVFAALVVSGLLARALVRAAGVDPAGRSAAALYATSAGLGAALALAAGTPVHAALFPAVAGHGHATLLQHALDDGAMALQATLPLAWLAAALGRRRSARPRRRLGRAALASSGAMVLLAAGALQVYADVQDADRLEDGVAPCFDDSPVGPAFTQPMPIPPRKTPEPGSPGAYTLVQQRSETEIVPGVRTPVWTYDGIAPGPTFIVDKAEEEGGQRPIQITVQNNLPPGEDPTSLVFEDEPSEEHPYAPSSTALHLHGINADHFSDGYPDDGDGHRHRIVPGEAFTHLVPNNDYQRPATLWYHDHSVHITSPHIYRGLAGLYIVQDAFEKALPLPKGYGVHDVPLILKDVMIAPGPTETELPSGPATLPRGTLIYDNCSTKGALGDVMTVNGKQQPFHKVTARKYRFRVLDGSDARQYLLALRPADKLGRPVDDPRANVPFTVIGSDQGLLRNPVPAKISGLDAVHVTPAERVEVVVDFKAYAGQRLVLVNLLAEPDDRKLFRLMAFDVAPGTVADESSVPAVLRPDAQPADPWPSEHPADVQPPSKVRTFEFHRTHGPYWTIDGKIFDPQRDDAEPALNTTERWVLENSSGGWGHPVHLHLGRFKIVKVEGRAARPDELRGWKDTVWLGPNQRITVDHQFWNFNGKFVFHCHNGSHEDFDMMSQFEVQPPIPPG